MYSSLCGVIFFLTLIVVDGARGEVTEGEPGVSYNGTVVQGTPRVYSYQWNVISVNGTVQPVRLHVASNGTQTDHLTVAVRQSSGILSWAIPFSVEEGQGVFANSSRTVCPQMRNGSVEDVLFVDVSTAARHSVFYTLRGDVVEDFELQTNLPLSMEVTPSAPVYYKFNFEPGQDFARVILESDDAHCAIASIQKLACPVYDLARDIQYSGAYQTFTAQAAVFVDRKTFGDTFYVVVLALASTERCENIYAQNDIGAAGADSLAEYYSKNVSIRVVGESRSYRLPVVITLGIFLGIYLLTIGILVGRYYVKRGTVREMGLFAYVFGFWGYPENDSDGDVSASRLNGNVGDVHDGPVNTQTLAGEARRQPQYGATELVPLNRAAPPSSDSLGPMVAASHTADADSTADSGSEQEVEVTTGTCWPCRAWERIVGKEQKGVTVADLSTCPEDTLDLRLSSYPWVIAIVSVFYGLPVIQLVYNYQTVLNRTGDQDLCYYNFRCIHRLGNLSAFNNVFSNIGYILLGLLFAFLTFRRHQLYRYHVTHDPDLRCRGLPQNFGLFYTLGLSLCMEGVMSGCYHVCPTRLNFQFDTSFMYIITCISLLRIYQSRHPDSISGAHKTVAFLALIIFIVVIGVLNSSLVFWSLFFVLYIVGIVFINSHLYFLTVSDMRRSLRKLVHHGPFPVRYPRRFVLLLLSTFLNLGLAVYGISLQDNNFPAYVLNVLVANMFVYLFYYVVLKLCYGEQFRPLTVVFLLVMIGLALPALFFYTSSVTSWRKSPAESRQLNHDCLLWDFYDSHDIWHFLSAGALFFYALILLTIDDKLSSQPRSQIMSW